MAMSAYEKMNREAKKERLERQKNAEKEKKELEKERERDRKELEKEKERDRKEQEREKREQEKERERDRIEQEKERARNRKEQEKDRARIESIRARLKIACEENELNPDFCVEEMAKIMMLDENASISDILQERDWKKFEEKAIVIFLEHEKIRKEKELENERIRKEQDEWNNFTKSFCSIMASAKTEEDARSIFNDSKYQAINEIDRLERLNAAFQRIIDAKLSTKIKIFSIKLLSIFLTLVSVILLLFSLAAGWEIISKGLEFFKKNNSASVDFMWKAVSSDAYVFIVLMCFAFLVRYMAKRMSRK